MKYDDNILKYEFYDDNLRIIAIVTDEKIVHGGSLRFYCRFLDDKGHEVCMGAGYLKKDEWQPIPLEEIKKIYYENKKED